MDNPEESLNDTEQLLTSEWYQTFEKVPLSLGIILSVLFIYQCIKAILYGKVQFTANLFSFLREVVSTSNTRGDTRLKRSVTRKLNTMLMNAHHLNRPNDGFTAFTSIVAPNQSNSRVMHNYMLDEDRTEIVGGIVWTWWRILNGSIFDTEGIWICTRLIISHVAQLILIIVLSFVMLKSVTQIGDKAQASRDELPDNTPQWVKDFVPTKGVFSIK